jgi:hypothetical protein
MFTQPHPRPAAECRESYAMAINRIMERFAMVVKIIETIDRTESPCTGDPDIIHGCQRALTAMLAELSLMDPAPAGKSSKAEKTALAGLRANRADQIIDPALFQRFELFINRILGTH